MKPRKLNTEKEGRLFAIATFQVAQKEVREGIRQKNWTGESPLQYTTDEWCEDQQEFAIYRTVPQSDVLLSAFADLFARGTKEAIQGFFAVWTDYIGGALSHCLPSNPAKYYASEERAGRIPAWGSVIFTHPKKARAALDKGVMTYKVRK